MTVTFTVPTAAAAQSAGVRLLYQAPVPVVSQPVTPSAGGAALCLTPAVPLAITDCDNGGDPATCAAAANDTSRPPLALQCVAPAPDYDPVHM